MPVRVTGIRETRDAVARASQEISDTERKLLAFAEQVDELTRASAASGQTPEGEAWAPRKRVTVRRGKASVRSPEPGMVGVQTGRMVRSVTVSVSRNRATLSIGRGARYAKYFVGYSSRQPARPILPSHEGGLSARALDDWTDRLADDVIDAVNDG